MICFFCREACGILAPLPGIKPTPPSLEGEALTTGPGGKSHEWTLKGQSPENRLSYILQAIGNILLQRVQSQHD